MRGSTLGHIICQVQETRRTRRPTRLHRGKHFFLSFEEANVESNISFFLSPLNYFDYDISIDSTNAIILTAPENPNDAYEYDDYGVSDAHCAPQPPAKLVYLGPQELDGDWKILKGAGVAERRRKAEKYHRIPMEL